jgi:hypothetical protein
LKSRPCRKFLAAAILAAFLAPPALAQEVKWYILAREDGCFPVEKLASREKLKKVPKTPQEFAEMMRERGFHVVVGLPEGFPKEYEGKVVKVTVDKEVAPVFVPEEICRKFEKKR